MATINVDKLELTQEHQVALTAVIWGWFLRTHHPYLWQTVNLAFDSAEATKEWAMKLPTKLIEAYLLNEALKRLPDIQL
ncbi:hypothetical protein ACFQE8_24760 [Salinirubellus sp. GCM10025818]|jgi:hypothetical protein|uniref:hypothetical protein n=1 Tax=Salinirubellus TaxID=2162630 RepID=UPI0030D35358